MPYKGKGAPPVNRKDLSLFRCPACGKKCFNSKKEAKTNSKRAHPGERFQYYRCGDQWHYGHPRKDGTR